MKKQMRMLTNKACAKFNEKRTAISTAVVLSTAAAMAISTFAADNAFKSVYQPIVDLLNSLLGPLLAIVGAVGTLYCVLLGVKFAKAEEPQDREKAKGHLKNAIIGFALIFVLILALNLLMPVMQKWVNSQVKTDIFTDVKDTAATEADKAAKNKG